MNNILVVDDEKEMRSMLDRLLTRNGYNVRMAENSVDTFNILNDNEIDVVLLDLVLPDVNGKDILKQIKEKYSTAEVIIISGHGTFRDVVYLIKNGADDFIEKPFNNDEVLSKVIKALKQKELNLKFKFLDEQYNNIRKLKEYNEGILNHMPIGILTVNNENVVSVHNLSTERILRMKSGQIQNKNILSIFKKVFNEYNRIESLYRRLKEQNEKFDVLFLNNSQRKDKEKCHFRVIGCHFKGGILIFITDITNEYNTKQQLLHSERMSTIGQFISSITHGLGNNMANIIANASGVVDEVEECSQYLDQLASNIGMDKMDKEMREISNKISECYKRLDDYSRRLMKRTSEMNGNIKSLLNYSRNRHQQITKSPANINTVIEESINIVKNHKYKDVEFIIKPGKNIPLVDLNTYQIRDVIIDIALNGIQAMEGKGNLTLTTKFIKEKQCIKICISDTGKGISEDVREKIFSAFYTTKKNGTGLGLTNVETAIKNHNGSISFQTRIEKGTTFYIELPVKG